MSDTEKIRHERDRLGLAASGMLRTLQWVADKLDVGRLSPRDHRELTRRLADHIEEVQRAQR